MYRHFVVFTSILVINNLWFKQVTHSLQISNVKVVYKPKNTLDPFMVNSKVSSCLLYSNNEYRSLSTESNQLYYSLKNIKQGINEVDFKNDLDNVNKNDQELTETKKMYQQQQLHQFSKNHLFILKQPEIIEGYYDIYQKMAPRGGTLVNSDDHSKVQNLTMYVTPSPSHAEEHQDLHHYQLNGYISAIATHATSSEASPITAASVKSPKIIHNIVQFLPTVNNNQNTRYTFQSGSNQYIYAPMRSTNEKELSSTSIILPYPPSFISITTTERPALKTVTNRKEHNKMPDLFSHRQYKSLWDSYIPSWKITKMLQQLQNKKFDTINNNLHTLALIKPF